MLGLNLAMCLIASILCNFLFIFIAEAVKSGFMTAVLCASAAAVPTVSFIFLFFFNFRVQELYLTKIL